MDLQRIRERLAPDLARRIDIASEWQRWRDEGHGDDSADGFVAWLESEHADPLETLAVEPVETTQVMPARFRRGMDGSPRDGANAPGAATAPAADTQPVRTDPARSPSAGRSGRGFPYVLLGKAGRGGMGTIHIARDTELVRRIALKELNADLRDVENVRMRFIREAQITAQLDHPNVVPVYALEMAPDGTPAYTMKLVQGQTFQALIEETRNAFERGGVPDDAHSLATRLEHFLKVADAMAYAHDKGVIHRDLKPANLMLGRHHEVYVMDWGLCRLMQQPDEDDAPMDADSSRVLMSADASGSASETRVGDLIGTPRYMSPEQASALHGEIDARSDQYALGLILYELVTLKAPYDGKSAQDVLANARAGRRLPVVPAYRKMRIARELRAVIERATAMLPADRYADVAAFAADLRRHLHGDAVHAAPDNGWQRVQRGIARHRQRVLIAILALIAASAASVVGLLWHNRQVVEQQNLKQQRMVEVRNRVDHAGDLVQTRLLQLEGALSDLASSTEQALQFATPGDQTIYLLRDFKDPAHAPKDLMPLPQFGGEVSLAWPVWTLAPGVSEAAALPRIRQVANLQAFYQDLFGRIDSVVQGRTLSIYDEQREKMPADMQTVAALGIGLGLASGIGSRYPGWTGLPAGYDPRSEAWYRIVANQRRPQWTDPTPATDSQPPIFSVSVPLFDDAQQFVGALALILVPQRFLHDLLDLGDLKGLHEVLLTDAHGDVLAFRHHADDIALGARATRVAAAVMARLKGNSGNTLNMEIEGAKRLVVIDDIDPLGWHLIALAEPEMHPDD